jgi:hypothetical protein
MKRLLHPADGGDFNKHHMLKIQPQVSERELQLGVLLTHDKQFRSYRRP